MKRGEELRARLERIRAGGEPRYHEKARAEGKLFCRERLALLLDAGSFVEDGVLANSAAERSPRRRRRDRDRLRRGPPAVRDGERFDGEGGLLGGAHGREDPAHPGARRALADSARLSRRFRRRAHHGPDPDVPRAARGGSHLPQPGAALRLGAPAVPALRPLGGRRRLHPGLLRRGVHGRGQREHVPGLSADGRDGDRSDHDARRDGRRAHALLGVGLRRSAREDRSRGDRGGAGLPGVSAAARRRARCRSRAAVAPAKTRRGPRGADPAPKRTSPSTCGS